MADFDSDSDFDAPVHDAGRKLPPRELLKQVETRIRVAIRASFEAEIMRALKTMEESESLSAHFSPTIYDNTPKDIRGAVLAQFETDLRGLDIHRFGENYAIIRFVPSRAMREKGRFWLYVFVCVVLPSVMAFYARARSIDQQVEMPGYIRVHNK